MKAFLISLLLIFFSNFVIAQNLLWIEDIDINNMDLRTPLAGILGYVDADIPSDGKVYVRFEGNTWTSKGDVITIAASNYTNWATNFGNVGLEVYDSLANMNCFTHTMVYDVEKGQQKFYAVGQNWTEKYGTGFASIKGKLIVEFIPNEPTTHTLSSKNIILYPLELTEAQTTLEKLSINAPAKGKILVSIDGSFYTNLSSEIAFTTNLAEVWEDSLDKTVVHTTDYNTTKNFNHKQVFEVEAGNYEIFAMAKKLLGNMETKNNAFYLVFTAEFIPEIEDYRIIQSNINFELKKSGTEEQIGSVKVDVQRPGKVLINFSGICTSEMEDIVELTFSKMDDPTLKLNTINVGALKSDDLETYVSFSTIVDVEPGANKFTLNGRFAEGSNGNGLASLKGLLSAKYIGEPLVSASHNVDDIFEMSLYPNPTNGPVQLKMKGFIDKQLDHISIYNMSGALMKKLVASEINDSIIDLTSLENGTYLIKSTIGSKSNVQLVSKLSDY